MAGTDFTHAAINMNNVLLKHKGHRISIAQHKDWDGRNIVQEILVWGPNVDDEIIPFSANGPWLIEALKEAVDLIDNAMETA